MKIDRLFSIVNILVSRKKVTASYLAEKFDVSVRTIYRDIDILSQNGVPIYCDKGRNGGISIMDRYSIDRTLLSDKEQNQILEALSSMKAAKESMLDDSIMKLSGLFKKQITDWIQIDFTSWSHSDEDEVYFNIIKDSIFNNSVISFDYFSNKGERTSRSVEPYKLVYKEYTWYMYGYCRMRKDFRFFKLSRMDNLKPSDNEFVRRHIPDIKMNLNRIERKLTEVKLKIDKSLASMVYDQFGKNAIIDKNDNYFIVHAKLSCDEWVIGQIISYGDLVEVLEPKNVRDQIKEYMKKIIKKYL